MNRIVKYSPQLIFLLMTSTLCMTYFVQNVVVFQSVIYFLVFILYVLSRKTVLQSSIKTCMNLYIIFAVLYVVRAFIELELLNHAQSLYANNSTVYYFLITGLLLPAFFVPKLKITQSYNSVFLILSIVICISLFISLYNIFTGNVILTADQRIQANERLGVIQYGHLGLTGALTGYLCYAQKNNKKIVRLLGIVVIAIGLISMLMAGTRGALVSAIVIIAIYLFAHAKMRSFVILIIAALILFQFLDYLESIFESLGAASMMRIIRFFSEGGDQSSGRSEIWLKAISNILESPVWGVSCFWSSDGGEITYVHNSFLEVTYALGLFGLFVFAKLNYVAIKACIHSIKSSNFSGIAFSFFYLQYFTYTFFSDSIIRSPLYWFFLLMMLNIRNQQLKIKHENSISSNTNL